MATDREAVVPPSTDDRPQRWRQRLAQTGRGALPFLAGIMAAFGGLFLYDGFGEPPPQPLTMTEVQAGVTEMLAAATPAPARSTEVYDIILPSLVVIRIDDARPLRGGAEQARQIAYRDNARDAAIQTQQQFGVGSGVIVNAEGAILTALHVVERARSIRVIFADGSEANAAIVAYQPDNNIAVLLPDELPETFAPATLGNPGALRIGDEAYAVGNPLGLAGSISAGVISGLNRTYERFPDEPPLERLIQFDSAVNAGSAGGPLLNRNGEVVGIVVGPVNPTAQETFIGIGFAVRIDAAGGAAGMPDL